VSPIFLGLEDALEIHRDQIARYGGAGGIRDLGLLQSALGLPRAGAGTQYFHADLFEMAAAYLFHIVKNHPFVDGNKRVGAVAALVFLEMNGIRISVADEALVNTVLAVAEDKLQKHRLAEFFRRRAR
jgi:death-on-curing protein